MKNYLYLLCLAIMAVVIVGCSSSDNLHFSGASESWEGDYRVNIHNTDKENGEFIFKYKKDDKEINFKDFSIMINDDESGIKQKSLTDRTVKFRSSCEGCHVAQSDDQLKVIVKWDGNEETFYLENK
ncbi:hypothetical protein MHH33_12725 [Paenisporosarcina sp. FSL H8-0542]|uniref:hypothetical protein n=1 Tax=Paenisporosarcina sp. FSL H8-0542 TaxID=2921401 RepID=UPI00315A2222